MSAAAWRPAINPSPEHCAPAAVAQGWGGGGGTMPHPVRLGTVGSLGQGGGRTTWEG